VRIVSDREKSIRAFVPVEYWSLTALLEGRVGPSFEARLVQWQEKKIDNKKVRIESEGQVRTITKSLEGAPWVIGQVEKKERRRFPAPPFITSRLQQEASRKLGFQPQRTMQIAQRLYEGVELGPDGSVGLITYMRTDSTRVSTDAIQEARGFIQTQFGRGYLPGQPVVYRSKRGAQDAHEAIRPTSMEYTPERVRRFLRRDHFALYCLVWERFVASQMVPALFDQTAFDMRVGEGVFRATGQQLKFDGFMRLYSEGKDDDGEEKEAMLPDLQAGDALKLLSIEPRQHFTQPPPRFTQATLIRELEEKGIGRPSTYAGIVSNILDKEYIVLDEKRCLSPTELGFLVTGLLVDCFPDILNVEFTAGMEGMLDKIEEGRENWLKVMKRFYTSFSRDLKKAESEMRDVKREEIPTEIACEKCGAMMVVKWGRNGEFLACPRFPECRNTKNFTRGEKGEVQIVKEADTGEACEQCGRPMEVRWGKYGQFLGCSGYPECKNIRSLVTPVEIGIACPACVEGNIREKKSRRGKIFFGCDRYPQCRFAAWDRPVAEACPKCKETILLEKVTKRAGRVRRCHKEECDYSVQVVE
jgi:DNA topoisomerase-1